MQVWSKGGEPYLTLGLYVDIGEELSDDVNEAAAAQKQVQYEGNAKAEVRPPADEPDSLRSQEIIPQDGSVISQSQVQSLPGSRLRVLAIPSIC